MKKRVLITIALTIVLLSINSYIWVSEKTNKADKQEKVAEDEPVEEWIKRNISSDSPLIQAIIQFYHEREQNKTELEVFSSTIFTETTIAAMRHIVQLGPTYTEEMISLIESNSIWSPILAYSLLEIHGLSSTEHPIVDLSEAGMKEWALNFRDVNEKSAHH